MVPGQGLDDIREMHEVNMLATYEDESRRGDAEGCFLCAGCLDFHHLAQTPNSHSGLWSSVDVRHSKPPQNPGGSQGRTVNENDSEGRILFRILHKADPETFDDPELFRVPQGLPIAPEWRPFDHDRMVAVVEQLQRRCDLARETELRQGSHLTLPFEVTSDTCVDDVLEVMSRDQSQISHAKRVPVSKLQLPRAELSPQHEHTERIPKLVKVISTQHQRFYINSFLKVIFSISNWLSQIRMDWHFGDHVYTIDKRFHGHDRAIYGRRMYSVPSSPDRIIGPSRKCPYLEEFEGAGDQLLEALALTSGDRLHFTFDTGHPSEALIIVRDTREVTFGT